MARREASVLARRHLTAGSRRAMCAWTDVPRGSAMGPGGTVRGRMHARWGFRHARGREPRNVADAMLRRFYLALSTTGFSMHTFTGVQGLAAPHRAHGPLNDGFSMHTFTEACGELVVWHRVLSTTVFPCTRSQHPENQRDMTSEWSLNDGFSMHTFTDGAPGRLSTTVFPCTRSQRDPDGAAPLPKPLSTTVFPCTRSQERHEAELWRDARSQRRFFHAHVHRCGSVGLLPCPSRSQRRFFHAHVHATSLNDGFSMHTFTAQLEFPLPEVGNPLNDGFSMHTFTGVRLPPAAARDIGSQRRFFHAHVHRGRAPTATTASRWHSRYTRVFRR